MASFLPLRKLPGMSPRTHFKGQKFPSTPATFRPRLIGYGQIYPVLCTSVIRLNSRPKRNCVRSML